MEEVRKKIWLTGDDDCVAIHTAQPEYDDVCDCWYSDSKHTIQSIFDEPEYAHEFTLSDLREIDAIPKRGEFIECEIILRRL